MHCVDERNYNVYSRTCTPWSEAKEIKETLRVKLIRAQLNVKPSSGINFKDMTKEESNVKVANETSSITSISDDILFLMKLYIKNLPIN